MTTSTRMTPPAPSRPPLWPELSPYSFAPAKHRRPTNCWWLLRRHQFSGDTRVTATLGWEWCRVCHRWVATSTSDMGVG